MFQEVLLNESEFKNITESLQWETILIYDRGTCCWAETGSIHWNRNTGELITKIRGEHTAQMKKRKE